MIKNDVLEISHSPYVNPLTIVSLLRDMQKGHLAPNLTRRYKPLNNPSGFPRDAPG
jgi:hypothetical protein